MTRYIDPMSVTPPNIYLPSRIGRRIQPSVRAMAGIISAGCLALLLLAAWLNPDRTGAGTHEQLHLPACQFLQHTGIPCPTCGMTTSFSWFVRGNLVASFYLQPMGFVLAGGALAGVWVGAYIALTGRSVARLFNLLPTGWFLVGLVIFCAIAWGWKIFLHTRGLDGWG